MQGLFNMTGDRYLSLDAAGPEGLPLDEAKMIHQFDHRRAGYALHPSGSGRGVGRKGTREVLLSETQGPACQVQPHYWVSGAEVEARLADRGWDKGWLMGWRDICRATDERTVIGAVVPGVSTGNTLLLMFPDPKYGPELAGLVTDQCSPVHDFAARQKVGGTHLKYPAKKQRSALPPEAYNKADLAFICPRGLELAYTAHDLKPWAQDLGHGSPPFAFDPGHRRAELDAWYERLFVLTRKVLCYILDPQSVMGEDCPSETFLVLRNKGAREFGEYRTRHLVLEAWHRLASEKPDSISQGAIA